jgi:hypothetical protein
MVHLTLNSGKIHRRKMPNALPQLEELVRPFLDKGGGVFPFPYNAYRIETDVTETGIAFYFFSGNVGISACTGTWSAECAQEYWEQIEKEYYALTDVCPKVSWTKRLPKMPHSVPWLATLILPGYFFKVKSDSEDVSFLNTCEFIFFEVAQKLARS